MVNPKLIVVSNRLPVSVTKTGGKLSFESSPGGLATAMSSFDKSQDYIWIGWPGIPNEELTPADKRTIRKELDKYNCYPVFLSAGQVEKFYDGYANATIWPLFHYFQSLTEHSQVFWTEYQRVNALFASSVAKFARADSTIWVHDYHLMLLPQLLRSTFPDASIGFFLHIPFPAYEIYRLLPNRKEVLRGLLGADLVGFHTFDYATHFLNAAQRILGLENNMASIIVGERLVRTDVFPIGIDYAKFVAASKSPAIKAEVTALKKHYADKKVVLSVDRLDYSKGILERLEAFNHFLAKNKRWHKKIVLVVIAVPSRVAINTYQHLREELERVVGRINGTYATVDWSPISYHFQNLPFNQLVALYSRADIALITPLRDGMNLVAKEYIATKQNGQGVLIISEMAGVADELPEAIRVNPNDRDELVYALESALKMSKAEQHRRLEIMQNRLSRYSVTRWAQDFIEQLSRAKDRRYAHDLNLLTTEGSAEITAKYQNAQHRLLMLDYDGTLTNFVSDIRPLSSKPSKKLLRILKRLIRVPGNEVMIVSGRPKYALDAWFKSLPVTLVAEHGAWIRNRGVWSVRSDFPTDWKEPLMHILQIATERTPGALIEDKTFSLVWHYRNVTPELAYIRKAGIMHDAEKFLRDSEIDVFEGHQVLEFKPRFITKGTAAKQKMGEGGHDFILAIGDDYTDEDLFEALPPGAFTIKVGLTSSKARYHLATVEHVLAFISQLSKAVPEPPAALTEDAKHEPDVKRRDHKGDPAGRKP